MGEGQVSNSEYVLMKIIWANQNKAFYSEIVEALEKENFTWKKNTILTFLARLVEKKVLATNKVGRKNEYYALVSEEEYIARQTKSFVGRVYEGNVKGLVSTLIQQDLISSNDLDELQSFWEQRKKIDE
ncbi:BlaI/MecI/CopY family transcriptional regulator [Isobaculum melis]|uniref:Predicted transcriptional regulator n=1 Tax=Isobaculum melis TaxID=142588 RepID=A0A1H9R384_9LACT|nr:BlaI/MecI/CopY family transcriptional regulator [Isobaculum melis]SER67186.1 Predicted transcriptional regulator [Isobaculum melis]